MQETVLWHLLPPYLLEEVSLARGGLGHLPPRGQGHIIRNLVRRLTQMLRGGTCWGHAGQGATRNGPQLQGGRGWVCTDMVGCECSAAPSISAGLCWGWKRRRIKNKQNNKIFWNNTTSLGDLLVLFDVLITSRTLKSLLVCVKRFFLCACVHTFC